MRTSATVSSPRFNKKSFAGAARVSTCSRAGTPAPRLRWVVGTSAGRCDGPIAMAVRRDLSGLQLTICRLPRETGPCCWGPGTGIVQLQMSEPRPQPNVVAAPDRVVVLDGRADVIVDARLRPDGLRPRIQQIVDAAAQIDRRRQRPMGEYVELVVRGRTLHDAGAAWRRFDRRQMLPAQAA